MGGEAVSATAPRFAAGGVRGAEVGVGVVGEFSPDPDPNGSKNEPTVGINRPPWSVCTTAAVLFEPCPALGPR